MDPRKKISSLLGKVPSFYQKPNFKGLYESYTAQRGRSPIEELDFIDEEAITSELVVADTIPSPPPKDKYVVIAAIGEPLKLLRYDATGKQIPFNSSRVNSLLQELDDKTKVGKDSRSDAEIRKKNIDELMRLNSEKAEKYAAQLAELVSLQKSKHTKKKSAAIISIETQLSDLERKNSKLGEEKSSIELIQIMDKRENSRRIQDIIKSPILDKIKKRLPATVITLEQIDQNATTILVEQVANAIRAIELDWKELEGVATDRDMSVVERLTDHFSEMDSEEREATKGKLATFKKAVDTMPDVTPSMKQVVNDMSKAFALAELKPEEKIVYQHALEIIHAMKKNDIQKAVLATERLGQFLSENDSLDVSKMKRVKKMLAKEMPISSGVIEIMNKAVSQAKDDTSFKERMGKAIEALSTLRYKTAKLRVERLEKGVELSEIKLAQAKIPCVFILEDKSGNLSGCYVAGDGMRNTFQIKKKQEKYIAKHFKEPGLFQMKGGS